MSAAPVTRNPFPGLRPFTQEEDYLLAAKNKRWSCYSGWAATASWRSWEPRGAANVAGPLRIVIGATGGRYARGGASWEIAVTHPGGNPLAFLTGVPGGRPLRPRRRTRPGKPARHLEPQPLRLGRSGQAGGAP